MYSRGVSPRIPSNPVMSQHPCGICLHSLILINQSVARLLTSQSMLSLPSQPISIQILIRPCPRRLHKLQDTPCSLHSDSDQHKDNINCTQPLASSTFNIDNLLHQRVASARLRNTLQLRASSTILDNPLRQCVIICLQGKCSFFFNARRPTDSAPLILEITFLLFPISDGST